MFPDGEAGSLLAALALPCAHCGGAFHEPLTLAAKRHKRDPRPCSRRSGRSRRRAERRKLDAARRRAA